jgi:hypothetical protein
MSTGKRRLLEPGETIQAGDQLLDVNFIWRDDPIPGHEVAGYTAPVRRPMTPAEEHAEELLAIAEDAARLVDGIIPSSLTADLCGVVDDAQELVWAIDARWKKYTDATKP